MKNNYNLEKIIDSLYNKGHTNFIVPKELIMIQGKLNKKEYNIYKPYPEATKVILYQKEIPKIKIFKIVSKIQFRHQDILGTILSLGIKEDTFGDIIKYQDDFYFFVLTSLEEYFKLNLTQVRNNNIELEEIPLSFSSNFIQEYTSKEYIVSSLRLDNIISSIVGDSRKNVLDKFKNKEIILNYDENIKPTRILKENDVFSIRKYGKYKYTGIKKTTKKGSFIIEIKKYI